MLQSQLFPKTKREAPKEAESINHKLLVRAGFIDQLMAGSWTLLPLGWRVVSKINQIIREEMNAIGGQEMLMPLMHPKEIWNETGRWDKADEIMFKVKGHGPTRDREYALSFTHEEIVMDLLRKHIQSYTDLPVKIYHFSTKFRNEVRATGGTLRNREFLMKDLYSAHASENELMKYYDDVKKAYLRIFNRMGLDAILVDASGGVFTEKHTHEFQVITEAGEDTIYYCSRCQYGFNKEIFEGKIGDTCPNCKKGKIEEAKSVEVGNIFPLGTYYSERMHVYYTDKDGGKKRVWFGSYGIGTTRVMGALVEVSHDDKGIIWFPQVAPFSVHLIDLNQLSKAKEIYQKLRNAGVEVLWDDRNISAGEKFADSDLIGIPIRLVVSKETKDKIEWKKRNSDKVELLVLEEAIKRLTRN